VQIASAIAPVAVQMLFVFDADEKSGEFRQQIQEVSGDRATFLPVREVENLFLAAPLLHRGLINLCEQCELDPPGEETVSQQLEEILGRREDQEIFPAGPPDAGEELVVVKGSQVLKTLWSDLLEAEYRKVQDGERLARASLEADNHELAPLVEILERLRDAAR
jgi:hypothetical protein